MLPSDDFVFLQVLARRGGSTRVADGVASNEICSLVARGYCKLVVDDANELRVALTEQGEAALRTH